MRRLITLTAIFYGFLFSADAAARLPDYSNLGPYTVVSGEYKYPASMDPLVSSDMNTELWAAVFRPKNQPTKPWPLVLFLHGNHSTCGYYNASLGIHVDTDSDYTLFGTCPAGYSVVKSHRGYDYLASRLASWGYVVVSINVNRGINAAAGSDEDYGLNLRRGRMVLRHLALLSQWNKNLKPLPKSLPFTLANTMDFSEVGLMGHSRGGEGMRAAWRQYRDDGSPFRAEIKSQLTIRSIFEIAPVDGQTFRTLDADLVSSMVLLSSCDGDVSTLEGVHVFDRKLLGAPEEYASTPSNRTKVRGTINMLGGNHNFFNTEWQESDAASCLGHPRLFPDYVGSVYQRITAINTVIPFFLGTVGKQRSPSALKVFDPLTQVSGPLQYVGGLAKGFSHSGSYVDRNVLENFKQTQPLSYGGLPHKTKLVRVTHERAPIEHDQRIRGAKINWPIPKAGVSGNPYIEIALAALGNPLDIQNHEYLGLRLNTQCYKVSCSKDWFNSAKIDASITLIDVKGAESYPPISLAATTDLRRPVGGDDPLRPHSLLQNAYIPFNDIQGVDKSRITALRITFDRTNAGEIFLAEISLQNDPLHLSKSDVAFLPTTLRKEVSSQAEMQAWADFNAGAKAKTMIQPDDNRVLSAFHPSIAQMSELPTHTQQPMVQLTLHSSRPFPVTDSLPIVKVGNTKAFRVWLQPGGQLTALFLADNYAVQNKTAPLEVKIGSEPVWKFGTKPAIK